MALLNHNFKKAMFLTPFTGHFDIACAAWTGYGNFTNNGTNFIGVTSKLMDQIQIGKEHTDLSDGNKIDVVTSYVFWNPPKTNYTQVNKTYYM